jgi:hypothetical protein
MVLEDIKKEQTKIYFEDHEQRLKMDCYKNMLEAMLDNETEIAEKYSRIDDEMKKWYESAKKLSRRDLLQERIYQNGYYPDQKHDEILLDLLQKIDNGEIQII